MAKEFDFLNIINNKIDNPDYLGDDCAYLKEYNLTISSDSLIEDVHFSRKYMTPRDIAKKAALSNISDILSSGAKPEFMTINLSGRLDDSFIEEFYESINETIKEYDMKLIGGDLTKSDKIAIALTVLGNSEGRNISSRKNAKDGYIVAVSGEFGSSAQGLYNLQNNIKDNYFSAIHKCPVLNKDASTEIACNTKHPYAMMDSSDGLLDCLFQIANKSKVNIKAEYNNIPKKTDNRDFVLHGGEDYSLVCAVHPDDFKNLKHFKAIGLCYCSTNPKVFIDNIEAKYKGYNHFE